MVEAGPEQRAREMPWTETRVDLANVVLLICGLFVFMISKTEHIQSFMKYISFSPLPTLV